MNSTVKAIFGGIATALLIPIVAFSLVPFEHWVTTFLYQRGEVNYYGYAAIRIAEMALFVLAMIYLTYQLFAPKRWTIPCLGLGLMLSTVLLTQCESAPLFDDLDMLRGILATAYGVTFLLALSGKVSV